MKASEMIVVKSASELKETDFIAFICISHYAVEYPKDAPGIIGYKDKKYIMFAAKGTWKNVLAKGEELAKGLGEKKYKLAYYSKYKGRYINLLSFKTVDDLIEECLVVKHHKSVELEFDEKAIIYAIENKPAMYSPSHN